MDGHNFFCSGWVGNSTVIGNQIARPNFFIYLWLWLNIHRDCWLLLLKCMLQQGIMVRCCVPIAICMAGIGEACSHNAALSFAAKANMQLKSQHSSTLPCSWIHHFHFNLKLLPKYQILILHNLCGQK